MATYLYECPTHGTFEFEHGMSENLEECPKCKEENLAPQKVKRLIAGNTSFILNGSGWAKDNYKG